MKTNLLLNTARARMSKNELTYEDSKISKGIIPRVWGSERASLHLS